MPVNVKVIHTREFVRATASGALDLRASVQALLDIASLIKQPGEYEILMDVREAEPNLSVADRYRLGEALAELPALRRSKIGILAPPDDADKAQFVEDVAHNRGANIKAFTDFEQAMEWLVMREQDA